MISLCLPFDFLLKIMLTDAKRVHALNGVFKYLPLKGVHFSVVQDMEQFYELWLKSQKSEKSDDAASQSSKENGKQIHMPTDYAEVTVSTAGWCLCLCFQAFLYFPTFSQTWLPRSQLACPPPGVFIFSLRWLLSVSLSLSVLKTPFLPPFSDSGSRSW